MKANETKRNSIIAVLSAVVVLFAALLWISTDYLNKPEPDNLIAEEESQIDPVENIEIYIPEIRTTPIRQRDTLYTGAELTEATEKGTGEEAEKTLEIETGQDRDTEDTVEEQKPQDTGITSKSTGTSFAQSKPSDGKPRTAAEAVPPDAPPVFTDTEEQDADKLYDLDKIPDSTPIPANPVDDTPKSGSRNENGDIYVPGFGWVPNTVEKNVQETADFTLSGVLVGEM